MPNLLNSLWSRAGEAARVHYNFVGVTDRTLIVSATNLLVRGFSVVPTDRRSSTGGPVNGLFAVARALLRCLAFKAPKRAVAIIDTTPRAGPELLVAQLPQLASLCRTLGFTVVETTDELSLCASYAEAAHSDGQEVLIAGVDKRYAQLVSDTVWWFDANKDVRYTKEIVVKRFGVEPKLMADWLALVGDEDQVPGVKGIGAKGATEFLLEHGSLQAALSKPDLEGRVAKALKAEPALAEKQAFTTLVRDRALPVPFSAVPFSGLQAAQVNALFETLGFSELLLTTESRRHVEVCEQPAALVAHLDACGSTPVAIAAFIDEPGPGQTVLACLSMSRGERSFAVAPSSAAWSPLTAWLERADRPKLVHDLVPLLVSLERLGVQLRGVVSDVGCLSHLCEPSGWAPHELPLIARQVLGVALPTDEEVQGTGRAHKTFSAMPLERVADIGAQRSAAVEAAVTKLTPRVEPRLLAGYLELSDTLKRMELTGLAVDTGALDHAETSFAQIEAELDGQIEKLAGHAFNVNSSKQLGAVLFEELKLPVVHHTRTGWSTANEALERIQDAHPIVPLVIRWRGLRRLRDSWLHSLRRSIAADGRVHSRFHLARSFAGDLINSNPDLGRVPGRTPEMAMVRRAFVAGPGKLLMSVDFNQLGLYVLAHLSKDPSLVEPLRQRADMHRLTAAAILRKPAQALTHEERQLGKVVNFATFAGQGVSALGMQLGVSPTQAREYIARFDEHYALVRAFQDEQLRLVRTQGFITTIAGRRWPIGGLESLDSQLRSYAERLSRRATHEGSVADVSRRALLEADRALRREKLSTVPLLQILDEVLFEVPETELERAAKVCSDAMRGAFTLEVPLVVGVEAGKNWADLAPVT